MKTIVLLWEFTQVFEEIKLHRDFRWVLIIEEHSTFTQSKINSLFSEVYRVKSFNSELEVELLIKKIQQKNDIHQIITPLERTIELGGKLRDNFGIRGLSSNQGVLFRNKQLMKEKARAYSIPCANSVLMDNEQLKHLSTLPKNLNYPIIIKPYNGSATKNTYKIENIQP